MIYGVVTEPPSCLEKVSNDDVFLLIFFMFTCREMANNRPGRFPIPLANVRAARPQQPVRPIGPVANANPIPGLPGPAVQNDRNLYPALSPGGKCTVLLLLLLFQWICGVVFLNRDLVRLPF